MSTPLPITELAIWTAALDRRGSPMPALLGAPLSSVFARVLMSGGPELGRRVADVLALAG